MSERNWKCCVYVIMYGVLLYCLAGNVPPGHANVAAQHVINMPTNMTPVYVQHHPGIMFVTCHVDSILKQCLIREFRVKLFCVDRMV